MQRGFSTLFLWETTAILLSILPTYSDLGSEEHSSLPFLGGSKGIEPKFYLQKRGKRIFHFRKKSIFFPKFVTTLPHVGPLEGAESHAGFWILEKNMKFPLQCRETVPGVGPVLGNFGFLFVL